MKHPVRIKLNLRALYMAGQELYLQPPAILEIEIFPETTLIASSIGNQVHAPDFSEALQAFCASVLAEQDVLTSRTTGTLDREEELLVLSFGKTSGTPAVCVNKNETDGMGV